MDQRRASVPEEPSHSKGYVVVGGAAGGIGRAVVRRFAASPLIVIDQTVALAEEALEEARRQAGSVEGHALACDFADPIAVKTMLRSLVGLAKRIDVLINCTGIARDAPTQMVTVDDLQQVMQVNFTSAVQLAQVCSRVMTRAGRGSIVNIASVTGIYGNLGQVAYGASKAAVINATQTMSMELAPFGIRVNAVAPGVIDTPMTRSLNEETLRQLRTRIAMGRLGTPDEVASVVSWLSSDRASYVTGQTICVDGGY